MYLDCHITYLFKCMRVYSVTVIWRATGEFWQHCITCVLLIKLLTFLSLGFCISKKRMMGTSNP